MVGGKEFFLASPFGDTCKGTRGPYGSPKGDSRVMRSRESVAFREIAVPV